MDYGDLGKRFVASIIDSFFVSIISAVFVYILIVTELFWIMAVVIPFIDIIYRVAMEGSGWHATLGKRAMGLYVGYENGDGVTYSTAIIRNISKIISGLIFGIGYLMCLFVPEKQCLHDRIAKAYIYNGNTTEVVTEPKLTCVKGPLAGRVYTITENGLQIGRDSVSCQVVIPASQTMVSRSHCFVTYNPISRMFIVSDRNSTHGTYLINGKKIAYGSPAALPNGSRFYIVNQENIFEVNNA